MIENYIIKACARFAAANAWRVAKHCFSVDVLAAGRAYDRSYSHPVGFDHAEFYRDANGRFSTAIVAHNYDPSEEAARQLAEGYDLVVHLPPAGRAASWYYPGHTLPICVTRPGVTVVWPTPEEMVTNAADHAAYWEKIRASNEAVSRWRRERKEAALPNPWD
jgi:hypothetical protein